MLRGLSAAADTETFWFQLWVCESRCRGSKGSVTFVWLDLGLFSHALKIVFITPIVPDLLCVTAFTAYFEH